ncbi:CTP pyrophosphohydrolase [Phycisphaerae bacterium RAS2]|jgi:8-oxo-dGTP diphosphatase|nr:CTP pyrophosphohydrolase [Phycisphaerae bacterium RAS2]
MPNMNAGRTEQPNRTDKTPVTYGILGILQRDGRVLLIQRSRHVRVPLAWCFPGGTIEPGESQPDALVRELHEEVNLIVRPGRHLMTQTKHDGRLVLHCWSAEILDGDLRPNPQEVADLAWLTPAEVRSKAGVLPGTTDILDGIGL